MTAPSEPSAGMFARRFQIESRFREVQGVIDEIHNAEVQARKDLADTLDRAVRAEKEVQSLTLRLKAALDQIIAMNNTLMEKSRRRR